MKLAEDIRLNPRIAAQLKRLDAQRATLLAEVGKHRRRCERERQKLIGLIGENLLDHAERTPAFKLMLKQVLDGAVADPKARGFLMLQGWLDKAK